MSVKNNKKIVIAAGGTLGHINPSLAVASELNNRGYDIHYITLNKNKNIIFEKFNSVLYVESFCFDRKNLLNNFKNFFKNNQLKRVLKKYIDDLEPSLVLSFGSSIGSITSSVSISKHIKTIIHEQNGIMGFGNKLVYNKVDKVLLTMPCDRDGKIVGNPVITKYYENYRMINGDRILIVCGSNGAKDINDFFINNYQKFKNLKITLITGKKYYKENIQKIDEVNSDLFRIIDFETNMIERYKEAKIVICRSGSSTLSELLGMRKLILTIPSINVSDNHQYYNAEYYKEKNCLELLEERELNVDKIKKIIELLEMNQNYYVNNIEKNLDVYSLYKIVDNIEEIIGGE